MLSQEKVQENKNRNRPLVSKLWSASPYYPRRTMASKFNMRNPAVKRIMQEMRELQQNPSEDIMAEALEDNIFEWHFAVRGAPDTPFQGGIYHGRILLPAEYPFKPPSFIMLSPSGRFEVGVKICLSMSSYHPEHWQPSWSVRSALVALIAFMPTAGKGAIGSVDFPDEERRAMARESRASVPKHGSPARQAITQKVHEAMLAAEVADTGPQASSSTSTQAIPESEPASAAAQPAASATPESPAAPEQPSSRAGAAACPGTEATGALSAEQTTKQMPQDAVQQQVLVRQQPPVMLQASQPQHAQQQVAPALPPSSWEDLGLTLLAGAIILCIVAIVVRKVLQLTGSWDSSDLAGLDAFQSFD